MNKQSMVNADSIKFGSENASAIKNLLIVNYTVTAYTIICVWNSTSCSASFKSAEKTWKITKRLSSKVQTLAWKSSRHLYIWSVSVRISVTFLTLLPFKDQMWLYTSFWSLPPTHNPPSCPECCYQNCFFLKKQLHLQLLLLPAPDHHL